MSKDAFVVSESEALREFCAATGRTPEDVAAEAAAIATTPIDDIVAERKRQIEICKHGGDTNDFDKSNSQNDWIAYVNAYTGRAAQKVFRNEREKQGFRENMVKAAAIIVAAIEAHDKGYC